MDRNVIILWSNYPSYTLPLKPSDKLNRKYSIFHHKTKCQFSNNIIIIASYLALISTQWCSRCFNIQYILQGVVELAFWSKIPVPLWHHVMAYNMQPIKPWTRFQTPSFLNTCTGFFNVYYTTHCFTSHMKKAAIMVKYLAWKDTSVTTRTRTHTLLNRNTRAPVPSSNPLGHNTPQYKGSSLGAFSSQLLTRFFLCLLIFTVFITFILKRYFFIIHWAINLKKTKKLNSYQSTFISYWSLSEQFFHFKHEFDLKPKYFLFLEEEEW